jgi:hypothetical protein
VEQIIGDKPVSFLTTNGGCIAVFIPQFVISGGMFLTRGWPIPGELRRKLQQTASAKFVLISTRETQRSFLDLWLEFSEALDRFEPARSGRRFLVYRRTRSLALRRFPVRVGYAAPDLGTVAATNARIVARCPNLCRTDCGPPRILFTLSPVSSHGLIVFERSLRQDKADGIITYE